MTTNAGLLIEKLIVGFEARRWASEPMTLALQIVDEHPESIGDLARAIMERLPEGGTFLDDTLSFLPEDEWSALVESAVVQLEMAKERGDKLPKAASSIVSYASLQCPRALHPYLERLFVLDDLFSAYYATYPWRESGEQHLNGLQKHFDTAEEVHGKGKHFRRSASDRRLRAWLAVLETRSLPVLERALSLAPLLGLSDEEVRAYYHGVGYKVREGVVVPLYPHVVWHLSFEEDALPTKPDFRNNHPTWHLNAGTPIQRFGGVHLQAKCQICGEALHHLLTLSPTPVELGVSGLSSLTLAACLSCVGWEASPLYYQHDREGLPQALLGDVEPHEPEFPSPPLRETLVQLAPTPSRWYWQDWGLSNGRENLHRLGGHPCWIQSAEYPECPKCDQTMNFLLQLDSELPLQDATGDQEEEHVMEWGSGGILYGFWCDACSVSAFAWQCT